MKQPAVQESMLFPLLDTALRLPAGIEKALDRLKLCGVPRLYTGPPMVYQ
jgi:hypothetical protein